MTTDPHDDYQLDDLRAEYAETGGVTSGGAVWLIGQVVVLREQVQRLTASSAVAQSAPAETALRDRIRRAVCEAEGFAWDSDMLEPDEYGDHADMVLAALIGSDTDLGKAIGQRDYWHGETMAATARIIELERKLAAAPVLPVSGRADTLGELADQQTQLAIGDDLERRRDLAAARRQFVKELRRLAGEAQQDPTPGGESGYGPSAEDLAQHLASQRMSVLQGAFRILGWPPLRFELVEETTPAVVPQAADPADETWPKPCGPAPDQCDAEAGEPCANHEREQAHAEGEHCFCGPECDKACTCGSAGDAFVPIGHYADCPQAAGQSTGGAQQPKEAAPAVPQCDGCGHLVHRARKCPAVRYGERCECDEPVATDEEA